MSGRNRRFGLPRMRGDRPSTVLWLHRLTAFTPHARGSTCSSGKPCKRKHVYPACAGIDRQTPAYDRKTMSLPRMRGDRPTTWGDIFGNTEFTPHARGSTQYPDHFYSSSRVYPACAGIDLEKRLKEIFDLGLPRMRGDRPSAWPFAWSRRSFTPHARGSTANIDRTEWIEEVYPACAGIDRVH